MPRKPARLRVSILAVSDTFMSGLSGFLDVLSLRRDLDAGPMPFDVEIVAAESLIEIGPTRMPLRPDRLLKEVRHTDIVIVPTTVMKEDAWVPGRFPEEINWLRKMHARGAVLCSSCSGVFLLAETGLLAGREATTHWIFERSFRDNFPDVTLRMERELIVSEDRRLVMSGASTAWHDLALYLVARFSGPATARSIARFFLLQWHVEGQAPYMPFDTSIHHNDAVIRAAQLWLQSNWRASNPVETMIARSGLSNRTFARRFRQATGHAPLAYVQNLRIERARELLETSSDSVDQISFSVGYDDASFFRRVFKRTLGLRPADYRRRFGFSSATQRSDISPSNPSREPKSCLS